MRALLLLLVLLAVPASASAETIGREGTELVYRTDPVEDDDGTLLLMKSDTEDELIVVGGGITPGAGCSGVEVSCSAAGITAVRVIGGAGDQIIEVRGPWPVVADLGAGNDPFEASAPSVVITGGPGDDRIDVFNTDTASGPFQVDGGAGRDTLVMAGPGAGRHARRRGGRRSARARAERPRLSRRLRLRPRCRPHHRRAAGPQRRRLRPPGRGPHGVAPGRPHLPGRTARGACADDRHAAPPDAVGHHRRDADRPPHGPGARRSAAGAAQDDGGRTALVGPHFEVAGVGVDQDSNRRRPGGGDLRFKARLNHTVVIFSGIQPTGRKHLGNYIGAILNYVKGQDKADPAIYCIVDLHGTTVPYEPAELRQRTRETAALLVAAGLDPERCVLFRQGDVQEHSSCAGCCRA